MRYGYEHSMSSIVRHGIYKSINGKNCPSSPSCHFVKIIFFNQTPSCICSMCLHCIGKIKIAPSKAVVEVDRPMKAITMHIQKPYKGKLSKFSQLSFCQKKFHETYSCICSVCLYCIGNVSNCSIKGCSRS